MLNENQRQAAIDWLNSKERNFADGIDILRKSGFKPGVVRRLENIGENGDSCLHLVENIRQYLRFFGQEVEDSDPELGVFKGEQPDELAQKDENSEGMTLDELAQKIESGEISAHENAAKVIMKYAKLYREREIAHRKLSEIGEKNDDESVAARKEIIDSIDALTDEMEKVYPLVDDYLDGGKTPTDEEIEAVENTSSNTSCEASDKENDAESTQSADYDTLSKEELQKLLKSAKTKILRKSNLLQYQQETKADSPNPLPDCPKRVKYETEIARLEKEVEALQYAIARK